jgi:hypothetical protein
MTKKRRFDKDKLQECWDTMPPEVKKWVEETEKELEERKE